MTYDLQPHLCVDDTQIYGFCQRQPGVTSLESRLSECFSAPAAADWKSFNSYPQISSPSVMIKLLQSRPFATLDADLSMRTHAGCFAVLSRIKSINFDGL